MDKQKQKNRCRMSLGGHVALLGGLLLWWHGAVRADEAVPPQATSARTQPRCGVEMVVTEATLLA